MNEPLSGGQISTRLTFLSLSLSLSLSASLRLCVFVKWIWINVWGMCVRGMGEKGRERERGEESARDE